MSGEWLDRLALRVARAQPDAAAPQGDEALLGRGELLRRGAAGALVLAGLGGLDVRRALAGGTSTATATVCRGGSLSRCYSESTKTFAATLTFCGKVFHERFDRLGCIVETVDARAAGRKECRASCPKPKKKAKGGKSGGGTGTTPPPSGGGGHTPTCGHVDCFTGDQCCPADSGPICCAICCNKSGNGCGSSSSDCN